ncbi:UDP-N-acetylmuramoyl-L-alanine--D-glutamate ligase [Aquisalibacillus elongatus]|uniref:UDP-N-acetylmuramoylalanine--D-glutamate ligase n=1 Tax=Aquisalibacillus elongatus TaxID=485577 RepID=A0A3N5BLM3_9BACI|nr:UDP-N-acetylmuramoyl-L-alanine--D-glutamate ligase [Aquisalibacillus elongatus]RPF56080.1 UDP-N-acetylmuramoylalanine--D-glutamate ligase [Aquisalibacillus elongatus]
MKKLTHFPYNQVLVLGLARSGEAAAQLLYDSEVSFKINDLTPIEDNQVAQRFDSLGVEVVTGHHPFSILDNVDLIVKNPGIPYDHKLIEEAEKRNIPVVTEIELAYRLIDGPIIAITGSNGKTTTTTLVHEVLNQAGLNPLIAGNIGEVATQVARVQREGQPVVMELSSFQLKAVQEFKPDIAVLLNITEAHLDYHKTMDDYVQSKLNITANQTSNDILIYNQDEAYLSRRVKDAKARLWPFSVKGHALTYVENDVIYFNGEKVMDREGVALPGDHNLENVLVAISIGKHFGVLNETIVNVLKTFTGVKHRLQYVDTIHARQFFNDSKATNISASLKAIRAFNNPIVLIAGGLDRGNEFDELVKSFDSVSHCVVYGQSAEKIKRAAERLNFDSVTLVDNLEQATNKAYEFSQPGDIILFSPACASWDQFKSFEERGDMFIDLVHKFY